MRTLTKICSFALSFSLLLGTTFTPLLVRAGFLSSVLGGDVYAETQAVDEQTNTSDVPKSTKNSQTLALLQSNVSPVSFLQGKKDSKEDSKKDDAKADSPIDLSVNIKILSDNALVPVARPLGSIGGIDFLESSSEGVSVYVVKKGDSISEIAEMFNVSVNTILWANDIKKGGTIKEGDVLFILPVSGVQHIVTKGETLGSIAKLYKVDVSAITNFNEIREGDKLAVGDEFIIPDAKMPSSTSSSSNSSGAQYYAASTLKNILGYFINPVPDFRRKSQGLHGPGRRGIDLAAPTGTKILASAGGQVLLARAGYNGGYGNMAIIEHPNGTKTLYAHMSKIATYTGASVLQREVIGYIGSTGRSTGPHLHFEVFNAKNPGADWSWAQ